MTKKKETPLEILARGGKICRIDGASSQLWYRQDEEGKIRGGDIGALVSEGTLFSMFRKPYLWEEYIESPKPVTKVFWFNEYPSGLTPWGWSCRYNADIESRKPRIGCHRVEITYTPGTWDEERDSND